MSRDMHDLIHDVRRIREALTLRGFSVWTLHNRLLPESGAPRIELHELEWALREAGIAVHAGARSITVLDVPDPDAAVRSIRHFRPYSALPKPMWYDASWKTFTRRLHARTPSALSLPAEVACLAKSMSAAGILVARAGGGRGGREPFVEPAGPYYGLWFRYWFEEHLSAELRDLNLPWVIRQGGDGSCRLTVDRMPALKEGERQSALLLMQEDAFRMGEWLKRRAREIREFRRVIFKYRSMKREAKRMADDPEALREWMYGRIAGHIGQ